MVRDFFRPANSAKIDGIVIPDLLFPIVGHHLPMFGIIVIAGKIKMIEMQIDIETRHCGLQHAQPFRNYFFANTITGDHRDIHSVFGHFVLSIHLLVNLGFCINRASGNADKSSEYRAAQHQLG